MKLLLLGFALVAVASAKSTLVLKDCNTSPNKLVHLSHPHLSSDPVHIPGPETGEVDVEIYHDIVGNHFTFDVSVQKHVLFGFITMPCVSNVGSCSYELCDLLSGKTFNNTNHCPIEIAETSPDFPCACPFEAGSYHLNATTFNIPELSGLYTWLASGDYKVDMTITDTNTKEEVACYHVELSTETDCTGFSCIFG